MRRADGSEGLYGVVERREFVVVVPWQDGCITMVEQYRYPIRRRLWELPMGTCEPGADRAETAATELREETGLVAGSMAFVASRVPGARLQRPGRARVPGHRAAAGPAGARGERAGHGLPRHAAGEVEAMIRTARCRTR